MKSISFFLSLCMVPLAIGFSSCNKDDKKQPSKAQLNVHLTDGPALYDAVKIDVQQIQIHSDVDGWVTFTPVHPGVYNLLDFSNGMDTLLCHAELPVGKVSQMRLILGNNNSVVVNGVAFPLATPSAQQSGLKFNINQDLSPNGSYDIWIDFDAGRSIVVEGNGSFSLKPVVRAYTALTSGKIKGYVLPSAANALVYAINGTDSISALPEPDGFFMFCGMPEGNYSIWVDALNTTTYNDTLLNNVPVTFGTVSDVGVITLSQ